MPSVHRSLCAQEASLPFCVLGLLSALEKTESGIELILPWQGFRNRAAFSEENVALGSPIPRQPSVQVIRSGCGALPPCLQPSEFAANREEASPWCWDRTGPHTLPIVEIWIIKPNSQVSLYWLKVVSETFSPTKALKSERNLVIQKVGLQSI